VPLERVQKENGEYTVYATVNGSQTSFQSENILAAMGGRPNTAGFGLEEIGVELDANGYLKVNEMLQTNVNGIYGSGDVIGDPMFVYTAAYEGALVAENAITNAGLKRDYTALPWVIFTDPQVAGVGLDEVQTEQVGLDVETTTLSLSHIPRSVAAHDTRGFIKLIRDNKTDKLLGARILAPEGSELLMELSLAIKYGIPVRELASMMHPYLTLSEGVKLAAITFNKKVEELSCCAN